MSDPRPLHATTVRHAPRDDFRPGDAIETLRAAILHVDTVAQVACDAVDELRYPGNAVARRAFARMQILVGQAADAASMALAHGDRLMAALTKHLEAQQDNQELGDQDDARARPVRARRPARSSPRARARGARRI